MDMTLRLARMVWVRGATGLALLLTALLVACGGASVPLALPSALPVATVGAPYRAALVVPGAQAPLEWQVGSGSLPPGLAFDPVTSAVHGEALQAGRYALDVTVRDATQAEVRGTVRLEVVAADDALVPRATRGATQSAGVEAALLAQDLPSLLAALPEGAWVQASLNRYVDVWAPEELRPLDVNGMGATLPSKIILAWSGFAWDSQRGDLILYGGGHANHPGNDMYRWRSSTRQWERAALPSEITRDASGNFTAIDGPDAAPAAAHTYDNNIYLPVADRFLTFGGAAYNNGGAYRRATSAGQSRNTGPYLWDPSRADPNKVGGTTGSHVQRVSPHPEVLGGQMWQNRDHALNLAGNTSLPALHLEGCTGYANEGGLDAVYVVARLGYGTASQLFRYVLRDVNNPQLDAWTQIGGYWSAPQGQTVCAYDPVHKLLVRVGNSGTPFTYWDTAAPGGNANYEKTIAYSEPSGEFAARLASGAIDIRYCGFDLDPVRRQYALWCGGADVWLLTPPAAPGPTGWTLQKQPVVGGTPAPTADTGTGILGKWKYIPNLDVFMALQDSTAGNIWLYKPQGWKLPDDGGGGGGGVPPTNQPPVVEWLAPLDAQQFTLGQVIRLQASAADADGSVAAVEFYDGTTLLARVTSAPWQWDWTNAGLGLHSLRATAYDNLGATQSATRTVSVVPPAAGGTVVLQDGLGGYTGTRDVNLASNAKNVNFGSAPALIDVFTYYTTLVRFAIFAREGGPVPDNATIVSAALELYKSTYYSLTLSAYRMQCDWQELQATWNSCRTGVPWAMAGAQSAGTDYLSVPDGSGLVGWEPGWVSLDVGSGVAAMQSGAPNFGWRIRRTAGDNINTKRFYARDAPEPASLRPRLTVRYSVP